MIEVGQIHEIRIVQAGSYLDAAAALNATTIVVEDAAAFEESGGQLVITSLSGSTLVATNYDYTAADLAAETITLATGLVTAGLAGDRVNAYPARTEKQAAVLITGSEDPVTAIVPHYLNDLLDEGIREEMLREQVRVTLENDRWQITDLVGQRPVLSSQNYDEGANTGWRIDDETSRFQNANVIGTLGADILSASEITLGDEDLSYMVGSTAQGTIAQVTLGNSDSDTATVSANTMMFHFTCTGLKTGRIYRISYVAPLQGTVTGDVFLSRIYFTEDGSIPTIGVSAIMNGSLTNTTVNASSITTAEHTYYYRPPFDLDVLYLGHALTRAAGTGTCKIIATNLNQTYSMTVDDMGSIDQITGTLSQKSKATGTIDGNPKSTYTKTYVATESMSYGGDNEQLPADTGVAAFQGDEGSVSKRGNTKSIVNFNDAQIRTDLTGATVNSVKAVFRVRHTYYSSGMTVNVRSHNYSAWPATYSSAGMSTLASRSTSVEGATYTVTLPVSFGTDLKNGVARGYGFWAPSTSLSNFGYMWGAFTDTPPKLIINYTK